MESQSAEDVYLLLKSSDFVTHDLEHAFDGCVNGEDGDGEEKMEVPYHLVLRKYFQLNPSVEFRCFVRDRRVIAICQRDLNHFEFLFAMKDELQETIEDFFESKLKDSFPDPNFVFDVYIPPPHDKVWLIDINPWAVRTDPLLFSWLELLTMEDDTDSDADDKSVDDDAVLPIFRLVKRDDPEAFTFSTQQFSAHKLPKDVVDASRMGGEQLRELSEQWKDLIQRMERSDVESNRTTA